MKTYKFTNRFVFSICIVLLLSLMYSQFAQQVPVVLAQDPYRGVTTTLTSNTVMGNDWPMGEVVTLKVDDLSTPLTPDYIGTDTAHVAWWNPNMIITEYHLDPLVLEPGFVVTMYDDYVTRTYSLLDIQVVSVDPSTDIVSGTAPAGALVDVTASDNYARRYVTAEPNGSWSVNFSVKGVQPDEQTIYDIVGDTGGYTNVPSNEWAQTNAEWNANVPFVEVNIDDYMLVAKNWPLGIPIYLTITGSDGLNYSDQAITQITPQSGGMTWTGFDFWDKNLRKLHSGDVVSITDGTTTNSFTITDMKITHIDMAAGTISGIATPGNMVEIYGSPDTTTCGRRYVLVDGLGNWSVDFKHPGVDPDGNPINETCDLTPGAVGQAYDRNNAGYENYIHGNATWIDWWAPWNNPPQITSITVPIEPVALGQSINATVEFNDIDVGDTHTVNYDWGDGCCFTHDPASVPSVTYSHMYNSPGVYTINAVIKDAAGAWALSPDQFVVIYDPSAGFVTGGGWIMSPAGAYTPDPSLEGKATFGFVSKYHNGQNVPDGNTEFKFCAGDLNFHSTSLEWLVVNQNYTNAQFKGYGTINGVGNYGFMIWAGDGSPDTFRIKIWDAVTEAVVYDNGIQQPIESGSIVIHK